VAVSNFLAIATVTAALGRMLQAAVQDDVAGAQVTTVTPAGPGDGTPTTGVNVFLYEVTPNAARRNEDLPTRDANGRTTQHPRAALDLHYLLTFYGVDTALEQQRLLGSVVRTLHARPLLTRELIADTISAFGFLTGSDLGAEVELVKFTPMALSLEELSKLWSVFFQTTYVLSTAYNARVVVIESSEPTRTPLPVRERQVFAVPFRRPVIEAVEPQMVEFAPGAKVALGGRSLLGDPTTVRFGALDAAPDAGSADTAVRVSLPAGLRAGVNTVRVLHGVDVGDATPRQLLESNLAAFVLRPVIANLDVLTGPPRISIDAEPAVALDQKAELLLTEFATPPPDVPVELSLDAQPRAAEADPLIFDVGSVPARTYLVRLRIAGAESALVVDLNDASPTFRRYIEPTVTVA
jgi:hypothetical protein